MNEAEVISKTIIFVQETLKNDSSGHDWLHIHRVYKLAKHIAKQEQVNSLTIELAALLHDISDWKMNGGDEKAGGKIAKKWLQDLGISEKVSTEVEKIISSISFKGAQVKQEPLSLEGKIVQDADRLDAIGAIGIARTFAYGGYKGRKLYDFSVDPCLHDSFEAYKNTEGNTLNHFYEKLLLLKDRMNTKTAKMIAEERHRFMELFLNEFHKERDFEESLSPLLENS